MLLKISAPLFQTSIAEVYEMPDGQGLYTRIVLEGTIVLVKS